VVARGPEVEPKDKKEKGEENKSDILKSYLSRSHILNQTSEGSYTH
jgi:hypothetical protein